MQAEFERNLPFALRSPSRRDDPDDPKSSLGIETKPFYIQSDDPYKDGMPGANFAFAYSYGDPQPVHVLAKRSLGARDAEVPHQRRRGCTARRRRSGTGGERYAPAAVYYREMRGVVTGTSRATRSRSGSTAAGSGATRSPTRPFPRRQPRARGRGRGLHGRIAGAAPGPHYLDYYLDALAANGSTPMSTTSTRAGRTAPDHIGVLSHYDAVVWYTGDDTVTRQAGRAGGNADRLAMDEILEFRAYMNEGGRVLYTGKQRRAAVHRRGRRDAALRPQGRGRRARPNPTVAIRGGACCCAALRRRRSTTCWSTGSARTCRSPATDTTPNGEHFDVNGIDVPFDGLSWGFDGPDSADNQDTQLVVRRRRAASCRRMSSRSSTSWPSSRYDKPGGPFEPHTGDHYVYSQIADVSYKRLTREIPVPAGGGN